MATSNYRGIAKAGGGFSSYAAGNKTYGGGRSMPTLGPVDPLGYRERDLKLKARRNALLQYGQKRLGR